MKTIIIRLDNDLIYITQTLKLTYSRSNLIKEAFTLRTRIPVYLEVEQVSYQKENATLKVHVINYSPESDVELLDISPKYPVERIEFEKMDWSKFAHLVIGYASGRIAENFLNTRYLLSPTESNPLNRAIISSKWLEETNQNLIQNWFLPEPPPVVENIQSNLKVGFNKAIIEDGMISFSVKLEWQKQHIHFSIKNEALLKEFEYIKPWFIKQIGRSFNVTICIKLINKQIEEKSAYSDEISSIDDEMIEQIKTQRILKLLQTPYIPDEVRSADDNQKISSETDGKVTDDAPNLTAEEIFKVVISHNLARNIRQLEFLSAYKQSLNDKIRFTLKPSFGFLFKSQSSTMQYLVWELLNSHATYVWETGLSNLDFYKFVEKEISFINANGREAYRKQYKSLTLPDFRFQIIEHHGSDLTDNERFELWKKKLITLMHDSNSLDNLP